MKQKLTGKLALLAAAMLMLAQMVPALGAEPERWLHVRVDNAEAKGEMVRVNVPLSFAEKVLPTVNKGKLQSGKVRIGEANVNGVDLHTLLDAVRSSKDGEFVTVQGTTGDVSVAKQAGYLNVRVRETRDGAKKRVEIRVPMSVVEALLSAGKDELDLVAAVRALAAHGDTELVSVKDEKSTIRIWVDSRNTTE